MRDGAKFARCLVSEIVAVNSPVDEIADTRTGEVEARTAGRRTGSRIDPLGMPRKVEVFKSPEGWDTVKEHAGRGAKRCVPPRSITATSRPLCSHSASLATMRNMSL